MTRKAKSAPALVIHVLLIWWIYKAVLAVEEN